MHSIKAFMQGVVSKGGKSKERNEAKNKITLK